jgi:hypothetical protein
MSYVQPLSGVVECALEQAQRRMLSQKEEAVLMISGLQMGARRGTVDKATCDHYAYPVWVSVVGTRHRASCLGCEAVGPVAYEGPLAARQALRVARAHAA